MNIQWCIIADDFTGAGDSAIQFKKSGFSVFLALGNTEYGLSGTAPDVLVVNTDSRFSSETEAYRRACDAAVRCRALGAGRLFKKIDSTLRGNVAAEIAAVMDAGSYRCAVVAPAAPKNGRTVVGGRCLVNGVPLSSSSTGKDPFNPAVSSRVQDVFEKRFPGRTALLDLEVVRKGPEVFQAKFASLAAAGTRIAVADAETMEDLRVAASVKSDESVLFAGASGLAEAVNEERRVPAAEERAAVEPGKVLFVVGSLTGTSREQTDRLAAAAGLRALRLDLCAVLEDEALERDRIIAEAKALPPAKPVLLRTFGTEEELRSGMARAAALGFSETKAGEKVSSFLGCLVRGLLPLRGFRAFFVTGGSTAGGIAEALHIEGIELLDEVLPGIPFGRFATPYAEEPLYIVSKSGGFGGAEAMTEVLDFLSGKDRTVSKNLKQRQEP